MYYTTQVPMLVSRQFGDEVILANFETGIYYSLAGTAGDIWLGIQAGATIKEIVVAFTGSDADRVETVHQTVARFIDELLTERIIIPQESVPERRSWSLQFSSSSFSDPVIERFDDLRELLFLDPVHDVGEAGWPMRAKDDV